MKLGDVLRKERDRKNLTPGDIARELGLSLETYNELESGSSPVEEWGPRLAQIAIKLQTPTSRLISDTGKPAQASREEGQCGKLISDHRKRRGLTQEGLAQQLQLSIEQVISIEKGESPLEIYAPILLRFATIVDQPIFNLFYPCGLPLDKLTDYP